MTHFVLKSRRALGLLLVIGLLVGLFIGPDARSAFVTASPGYIYTQEAVTEANDGDDSDPHDIDPALLPPEWGPAGLVAIPHPDTAVEPSQAADDLPPSLWLPNVASASRLSAPETEPEPVLAPEAAGGGRRTHGDLNGDGYDDIALGVPYEGPSGVTEGGIVHIVHGGDNGLPLYFFTIPNFYSYEHWGSALAFGDFNGDGRDDFVASMPNRTVGGHTQAGEVNIYYSNSGGLTPGAFQVLNQDTTGVLDTAEPYDHFGSALATGDFNGDGKDDLAVGVPDEDVIPTGGPTFGDAGVVQVFYGSASGITAANNQIWRQNTTGIADDVEASDQFGKVLIAGDFNGNGKDDLVIGVPYEDIGTAQDAGAVHVIYGIASGLSVTNSQYWHQDVGGIADVSEPYEHFGWALAAANFDGNAYDDLAISAADESIGSIGGAGIVHVLYGTANRLTTANAQLWSQNTSGILETAEGLDAFGWALTAGDFNGDYFDDLVVGVPYESVGSVVNAGMVHLIFGSATRLAATGNQAWHQNKLGVLEVAEPYDQFARSLGVGDFDGNGADDLAIGTPYEDVVKLGSFQDAGIVQVIYGLPGVGLLLVGDQIWDQDIPGMGDFVEANDHFGEVQ